MLPKQTHQTDINCVTVSHTNIDTGLTNDEVSQRPKNTTKRKYGNLILIVSTLRGQVTSIFFFLLLVSGILSYYLGEKVDAWIFFTINIINVVLGFVQEFRAAKAAEELQKLVEAHVYVVRNSIIQKIKSDEVVVGDIISLQPGSIIVVDVIVRKIEGTLQVDESIRTGETTPIIANTGESLYAGGAVVAGRGLVQVIAVGENTSLNQYSDKIADVKKNNNFAIFTATLSQYILVLTIVCMTFVYLVAVYWRGVYTASEFILFGISMLVGAVPESLALIITIILTREALELSKNKVIVKRLSALQELGSMSTFLTDKTGTITENNIRAVNHLDIHRLSEYAHKIADTEYDKTPMDESFDTAIKNHLDKSSTTVHSLDQFIPFENTRGYAEFIFNDSVSIYRGRFDSITALVSPISNEWKLWYEDQENKGLRVLAFAYKKDNVVSISGFVSFEDPIKKDSKEAYDEVKALDIDVKIITGDSPLVSTYVASKIDPKLVQHILAVHDKSIADLTTEQVIDTEIFARCLPEQKLEIINRHIEHGVVGFLGEGINDALALKRADVGITVSNASDVARQSADILLTEKSLAPIAKAVQLSRRAYLYITTYLLCTLAGNLGTLFSLTLVASFWHDLPMLPTQILLNNLLTDLPLALLITDALHKDSLKKPITQSPRALFKIVLVFAGISSLFDMTYFLGIAYFDAPTAVIQTGWFVFSVISELFLVLTLRRILNNMKLFSTSKTLGTAIIACFVTAFALPLLPMTRDFFKFQTLSMVICVSVIMLAIVQLFVNEIIRKKYVTYLRSKEN